MKTGVSENLSRVAELLSKSAPIPIRRPDPPTLMQVAGVATSELPASQILAFYLDPNREHGFEDIVLRALLTCAGCELSMLNTSAVTEVQTERTTSDGKRIDILLQAEDFVCCIENKILAPLNNDLSAYEADVSRLSEIADISKRIFVLLTVGSVEPSAPLGAFVHVDYASFFRELERRLGPKTSVANPKYLLFLVDFIQSIRRASETTHMGVNPEFLELARTQEAELEQLTQHLRALETDMRRKVEQLRDALKEEATGAIFKDFYRQPLFDSAIYHVSVNESKGIDVGARIRPGGWQFRLRAAGGWGVAEMRSRLVEQGVEVEVIREEPDRLRFCDDQASSFPYATELQPLVSYVAGRLQELTRLAA